MSIDTNLSDKPKYVYHGSGRKIDGDVLIPKKASDLGDVVDNSLEGIYASSLKDEAIVMGILKSPGVKSSSCTVVIEEDTRIDAVIYDGWPQQDYFYLYTLPGETFENIPNGSSQYVSFVPVKPEKIEMLAVKDFIYLVRSATDEEKREFFRKFDQKIKDSK